MGYKYTVLGSRYVAPQGKPPPYVILQVLCDSNEKVPIPIRKNPEPHIRRIVEHLRNLFNARSTRHQRTQEELCRTVLRTIVLITKESQLEPKTWEVILMFLLHVTDILLAPPLVMDHLGPGSLDGYIGYTKLI